MKNRNLFVLLVSFFSLFAYLYEYILVDENIYFGFYAEQLTYEQIEDMLANGKKWEWLSYAIIPFFYAIKLCLVAGCLSIGALFVSNRFEFKKMWGAALVAEFVFIVPIILKILWFAFIQTNYTLKDLQLFYPLSLLNLFDVGSVEPWLLYPLQVFNVFEVVYWLLLAWGVAQPPPPESSDRPMGELTTSQELVQPLNRFGRPPLNGTLSNDNEMTFGAALQLVLVSYGLGLLVWVALVMFLTLSYS